MLCFPFLSVIVLQWKTLYFSPIQCVHVLHCKVRWSPGQMYSTLQKYSTSFRPLTAIPLNKIQCNPKLQTFHRRLVCPSSKNATSMVQLLITIRHDQCENESINQRSSQEAEQPLIKPLLKMGKKKAIIERKRLQSCLKIASNQVGDADKAWNKVLFDLPATSNVNTSSVYIWGQDEFMGRWMGKVHSQGCNRKHSHELEWPSQSSNRISIHWIKSDTAAFQSWWKHAPKHPGLHLMQKVGIHVFKPVYRIRFSLYFRNTFVFLQYNKLNVVVVT